MPILPEAYLQKLADRISKEAQYNKKGYYVINSHKLKYILSYARVPNCRILRLSRSQQTIIAKRMEKEGIIKYLAPHIVKVVKMTDDMFFNKNI
jgi:hypothetical protein